MIYPDTQVQYLDLNDGGIRYKSVEKFYQEYVHMQSLILEFPGKTISTISFKNKGNIRITDLFGWTYVLEIRKIIFNDPSSIDWIDILVANKQLMVSDKELLPIYNINDSSIGFHGEVKYKYNLMNPLNITNGYLRIHNGEDEEGSPSEFAIPQIIDTKNSKSINVNCGYQIITQSGFYNGNDIHLYGKDFAKYKINSYK